MMDNVHHHDIVQCHDMRYSGEDVGCHACDEQTKEGRYGSILLGRNPNKDTNTKYKCKWKYKIQLKL